MNIVSTMVISENIKVILDNIFQKYDGNVPGAAVSVSIHGDTICHKIYGRANLETGDTVKLYTNFRLASVTKQFTATCVMILKEKGKLSYDDSLRDLLPEFPQYAEGITIRQMLQHTSGIRDYDDFTPENYESQLVDGDVLEMLVKQDSTYFPPGSAYRYSNSAYVLLGLVVERLSEDTFSEFIAREIFKPLGMGGSVLHVKGDTRIMNRAYGYARISEKFVYNDQSRGSLLLGDGGVYSNVVDLVKWDKSLYSDSVVSRNSLVEAFTHGKLSGGEETNYGYGWHITEYKGVKLLYHGGSTAGFRNLFIRAPEFGISIIILTNRNTLDFNFGFPVEEFKNYAKQFLRVIEPVVHF